MNYSSPVNGTRVVLDISVSTGTTAACVIMAVCFLVGTPGNLLVIWSILKYVKQRSHTVLLILNLAVADLLVLITLPLWIYSLARSWVFGEAACKAMVYVIYASMYSSVFIITIMSVERFLAVRYPLKMLRWQKETLMCALLTVTWILSFTLGIPILLTQCAEDSDEGMTQCLHRDFKSPSFELFCTCLETLLGFVVPFITLAICYCQIATQLQKVRFQIEKKSFLLIGGVVVVFILCWLPHHILNVITIMALLQDPPEEVPHVPDYTVFISGALVFISSSTNPLFYTFASRNFHGSMKKSGIVKLFQDMGTPAPQPKKEFSHFGQQGAKDLERTVGEHRELLNIGVNEHKSPEQTTEITVNAMNHLQPQVDNELGLVGACVIMAVCFLVGTPGNLLVIWSILKYVKQRSHTVLLILNLAVADLLVLITLPLWIYSLARSWVFGEAACKAMVYVIYASMYSSVFIITIMSVERFLAVRYPFVSARWKRKQILNKVLLSVWTASFLLSIPVIRTQTLDKVYGEDQCLFREYESDAQEAVLVILETLIGFLIPFITLLVCYGCLFSRIAQMNFKSKRKSTVLICSVVVMFGLCWIPHHVGNTLSLISVALKTSNPDMADSLNDVCTTMSIIAGALVFVSSSVNPVLYMFAARTFRSSLRETGIQKLFQHLSSGASVEGNKELAFVSKRQSSEATNSHLLTEPKTQTDVAVESSICTSD
ncbi:hypothetical protein DNTS_006698 [Danionella cerebrum]|uniref:G-protein coupled receptors family 1 profile domain-containing protein n=1 Tax=Danionella cerebrum TaxID=2873325 RepID=A0A553PWL2_9TELE|nr:hypothetical protein DNTS_006698 [Danionella translucida]